MDRHSEVNSLKLKKKKSGIYWSGIFSAADFGHLCLLWPPPENITRQRVGPPVKFVKGCVINIRGFLLSAHHNLLHFLQTSFFWKFLFLVVDKLEGLIVGLDSGSVYLFTPDSWFSWSGAIPVSINILPSSSRCLIAISRVHRFPQFRFTETVIIFAFQLWVICYQSSEKQSSNFRLFQAVLCICWQSNKLSSFLVDSMTGTRYVQNKTLFLFLILLVCIYFYLRDSSLEMSLPIT